MVRSLRIATTVVGLAACVLLAILWTRGQWYCTLLKWMTPSPQSLTVGSTGSLFGFSVEPRTFLTVEVYSIEPFPYYHDKPLPTKLGFYYYSDLDGSYGLLAPYWLLIIMSLAMAAAPWMRWHFSVRTLLVAATLIVVLLGALAAFDRWTSTAHDTSAHGAVIAP